MSHPPPLPPTGSQPARNGDLMAELPASIRLETGKGGLPVLRVDGPAAREEIYLHGATVTEWAPRGGGWLFVGEQREPICPRCGDPWRRADLLPMVRGAGRSPRIPLAWLRPAVRVVDCRSRE